MDISVVIPVYNSAKTIVECVSSVERDLAANPYSWEIILINDGSKDNSADLINQYIKKSANANNIKLINQENKGAAVARNAGLKAALGTFIAFNDSDDQWIQGKTSYQMQYMLAHTSVDMIAGIYGDDNLSRIKKLDNETLITIRDQVFKNYFSPPTVLFKASILKKSGLFCETMRHAEEGYFFNCMVYHGKCILLNRSFAKGITNKGRWGDNGLSGKIWKMESGELFNIKQAYKNGYINYSTYLKARAFSVIKFARRAIITYWHRLWK